PCRAIMILLDMPFPQYSSASFNQAGATASIRITILVGLAVLRSANFLDPLEKRIRPFIEGRLFRILRATGTESAQLLLVHHLKSCHAEIGSHRLWIQVRDPLEHQVLRLLHHLLVPRGSSPRYTHLRIHESGW